MLSDNKRLIRDIEAEARSAASYVGEDRLDPDVLKVMASVPRHKFVPNNLRPLAYNDGPLPIGHGQTISQPYIVALMTHLLRPQQHHIVLEVGTGSGYQAAVLSRLVKKVYTIEIVDALATQAKERLRELAYANVEVCYGNGQDGLPAHAPYDGIIVTAAAPFIPPALLAQLKPGGRLVVPVGDPYFTQELFVLEKDSEGKTRTRDVLPVAFVPLTGTPAQSPSYTIEPNEEAQK